MNSQYLDRGKYDKDIRRNKSNNEYVHDIWYIIRIFKSRCATKIIIPLKSYYTQLHFLSIFKLIKTSILCHMTITLNHLDLGRSKPIPEEAAKQLR